MKQKGILRKLKYSPPSTFLIIVRSQKIFALLTLGRLLVLQRILVDQRSVKVVARLSAHTPKPSSKAMTSRG